MPAVTIAGTNGSDTLVLATASADSGSTIVNGAPPSPFSGATSFTFNASTGNNVFLISNPTGGLFGPSSGITYSGGGQAGEALEELGGAVVNSFCVPTSANAGKLEYETQEAQQVTVSGSSGTFTLSFNGQTTSALPFNATANQVQTALGLEAMTWARIRPARSPWAQATSTKTA